MESKRVSTALPLALVAFLVVASMAQASVPTLERPAWTVGDSWTYESNTTIIPGLNLTGSVTATVRGRVPLASGGSSAEGYDVLLAGTGSASGAVTTSNGTYPVSGVWILTSEEWFEPVGLQLVYDVFDLEVNGTANLVFPFSARVQNTTTYQVLATNWQYPLVAGSSGSMSVGFNFTQDTYSSLYPNIHQVGVGTWNVTLAIGSPVDVPTPAGTLQAFPVTETWPDGRVDRSFASPAAGNDARTESYTPDGNLTAVSTLTAYRYQALETPTFLGLTTLAWTAIAVVAAAVVGGLVMVRRRRRKKKGAVPPETVEPELTSGPRGP